MVISDEIYEHITYGGKHESIAQFPEVREQVVIVNGVSKAYAMTGWRMGYLCAPKPMAKQIYKIHQYGIMCAPTTAQFAAVEAMRSGDEDVAYMTAEYNRRRTHLVKRLREIGIQCFTPEGAFYVFPSIKSTGLTSEEFCTRMIREGKVAAVPGACFGAEGYLRLSYCYSDEDLKEGLDRVEKFIKTL